MDTLYKASQIGFLILPITCMLVVIIGLRKILRRSDLPKEKKKIIYNRVVVGAVLWMGYTALIADTGIIKDFSSLPPKFFLFIFFPMMGIMLTLGFSRMIGSLLDHIPLSWPIYFQSFRIVVELLLWMLFVQGTVPLQMTFEGYNYDIITGLLAIPAGILASRRRQPGLLLAYNILGLGLVSTIVIISILSTPVPFRLFMNGPANTFIADFPFVWLPAILVMLAFFMHIVSIRQVWRLKKGNPPTSPNSAP